MISMVYNAEGYIETVVPTNVYEMLTENILIINNILFILHTARYLSTDQIHGR